MQLSLPTNFPAFPEPAPSTPGAAAAKNDFDGSTSGEGTELSFEKYLSKPESRDAEIETDDDEADETDAEIAASVQNAWFWMPVPPAPVSPQLLPSSLSVTSQSDSPADEGMAANADTSLVESEQQSCTDSTLSSVGAFPAMLSSRQFAERPVAASPVTADATSEALGEVSSGAFDMPSLAATEASNLTETADSSPSDRPKPLNIARAEVIVPAAANARSTPETVAALATRAESGALPENASNTLSQTTEEKIAALDEPLPKPAKAPGSSSLKHFLTVPDKGVSKAGESVGITVAKVSATMSATATPRRPGSDSLESVAGVTFSPDTLAPVATLTPEAPTQVSSVPETLAAVASAVDALESRAANQRSMEMQFNVGDQPLGVRVELRNGTVHTLFRTESPELREALSHEWNTSVPVVTARDIRVADPVFSSSSSGQGSSSGSLGQQSSQQRGEPAANPSRLASFARGGSATTATAAVATTSSPVHPASKLLHAFA